MLLDGIRTLDNIREGEGKVLLRLDLNAPVDDRGRIQDDTKIRAAAPTLRELIGKRKSVVIMAHQGRPGDHDFIPLEQHCRILSDAAGVDISIVDDICGNAAIRSIRGMSGSSALMLQNIRMLEYEQNKATAQEHAQSELVQKLHAYFDYFVNDAFAAVHRAHCSMVGFTALLPSAAGRLMESELRGISPLIDAPVRPVIYVFGGRKFEGIIPVIRNVLDRKAVDNILLTGYLSVLFLVARGKGTNAMTYVEREAGEEFLEQASALAEDRRVMLPQDLAFDIDGGRKDIPLDGWPEGLMPADIGRKSVTLFTDMLGKARTVFISGPAGIYEKRGFEYGTEKIFEAATAGGAYTVIGGGHTAAAARQLGYERKVSYASTGGGALEMLLMGRTPYVIEALRESAVRFSSAFIKG